MEEPLNIAVCEDSPEDEEKLLAILAQSRIPVIPHVFRSGEALLEAYRPMEYDLILSDIYMTGITGVETVTKIREIDEDVPVAFVTTSPDHALESYRLNALKYIEKPYRAKEIESILQLAKMSQESAPALEISQSGKEDRIRYSQILYAEQQTHHVCFCLKNGEEITVCEKLSAVLPELEENGFFSPHKSYAVNLSHVKTVDTELKCFVMSNGANIPIRRETVSKARKALEQHLLHRLRGTDL